MKSSVGLVADDMAMLHRLRNILTTIHCDVKHCLTAEQLLASDPVDSSLWLVVSKDAAEIFDCLSEWTDATIFLADDMPSVVDDFSYKQWRQRLEEKVTKVLQQERDDDGIPIAVRALTEEEQFEHVWVIAASLGGPEAVKVFLSHLNADLPIAFIYAQHIEESFAQFLPDVLNKECPFEVSYGESGTLLKRATVTVIPSHRMTQIDERGCFQVAETLSWKAPYTPNLDQLMLNVAKNFGSKMGVIVFSGMCDDGAMSALNLSKKGVPVWAQKPDDCICSSMPDAVIANKSASYIGNSKALAQHLNQRYMKF
ncbi:MAG: chemotaxis protein CheB [Pseudomonadales bacterium]|nr:chemotaxis protein CheB [Pseudomonadales bacterium]